VLTSSSPFPGQENWAYQCLPALLADRQGIILMLVPLQGVWMPWLIRRPGEDPFFWAPVLCVLSSFPAAQARAHKSVHGVAGHLDLLPAQGPEGESSGVSQMALVPVYRCWREGQREEGSKGVGVPSWVG
jgi:hypothetical protein